MQSLAPGADSATLSVAVMLPVGARRRHVERRVAVEEANRLQREAGGGDLHHRPVLRGGDVVGAEAVPEDDVGVFQIAICRDVAREAGAPRVLVRVVAGGIPL